MAVPPYITVTYDPPLPSDTGAEFDAKAFDTVAKFNPWGTAANGLADYVNARALEAEAAVLTGDVTPNAANALDLVRLNADGTGLEYVDLVALKALTAEAEAGTGTGLMDPVLTKAAIAASGRQWATELATTSGTGFNFLNIPAGVREIVITFDGVSLTGTNDLLIQLGHSGGLEMTGYDSLSQHTAIITTTSVDGMIVKTGAASRAFTGEMTLLMPSANKWVSSHVGRASGSHLTVLGGGVKTLPGELTRVSLMRTGADKFNNGSINIGMTS